MLLAFSEFCAANQWFIALLASLGWMPWIGALGCREDGSFFLDSPRPAVAIQPFFIFAQMHAVGGFPVRSIVCCWCCGFGVWPRVA